MSPIRFLAAAGLALAAACAPPEEKPMPVDWTSQLGKPVTVEGTAFDG